MAYSRNQAYIPVLLEFLRFQNQTENITTMTSYLTRLKDNVPMEELLAFAPEQNEWNWRIEWLGNNPQVQPPDGYVGWKGDLYSLLGPGLGGFLYNGAKSGLRVEEIVWGGVSKNGIPDLIDPPVLSATDADYLLSDDRVFGVSINGEHRAYPLALFEEEGLVNDTFSGQNVVIVSDSSGSRVRAYDRGDHVFVLSGSSSTSAVILKD